MASCTVLSSKEEWSIDMALYIDSAFLHDIMNVAQTVPVAGVTTNPTILLAARERGQDLHPQGVLDVLLRSVAGTIFMQPGASDEEGMHAEALAYIQTAPNRVIPKLPTAPESAATPHCIHGSDLCSAGLQRCDGRSRFRYPILWAHGKFRN